MKIAEQSLPGQKARRKREQEELWADVTARQSSNVRVMGRTRGSMAWRLTGQGHRMCEDQPSWQHYQTAADQWVCRSHSPSNEHNDHILKKFLGLWLQCPKVLIRIEFHFITNILLIDLTNNLWISLYLTSDVISKDGVTFSKTCHSEGSSKNHHACALLEDTLMSGLSSTFHRAEQSTPYLWAEKLKISSFLCSACPLPVGGCAIWERG